MSDSWYYARSGQSQGPVTWAQLKQLAASGGLAATDMVWTDGMAAWQPAAQVPDLLGPAQAQNIYAPPPMQQPPPGLYPQMPVQPQYPPPGAYVNPQASQMTALDWIVAILCPGIGCIVGIVYLCTSKPKGGMMLGISVLSGVVQAVLRFALFGARTHYWHY